MANYFQDPSQSFVPSALYKPNFDALQMSLMSSQQKYDSGLASVQSAYNSVLNAPITNGLLGKEREQYIKDASQQLKGLGSVDLSIESNQLQAKSVFNNFYKNTNMQYDMAWTNQHRKQVSIGENMQDSTDDDVRAGYWAESMQDLHNAEDDVRNGKAGDKNVYSDRRYVAYKDIGADAMQAIKDAKLKFTKVYGKQEPQLVSITGGPENAQALSTFLKGRFGNKYDDMFAVQGRVEYRNRYNRAIENGSTPDNAKFKIANDFYTESQDAFNSSIKTLNDDIAQGVAKEIQYQDENHEPRPEFMHELHDIWTRRNQNEKQRDAITDNLNKLQTPKSVEHTQLFDGIQNKSDEFFGNMYRNRTMDNLAVGLSMGREEKVEENKGYYAEKNYQLAVKNSDLEFAKFRVDAQYKNAQTLEALAKTRMYDRKGTTLNADGTLSTNSSNGSSDPDPNQGTDIGLETTGPVHTQVTSETMAQDLSQKYISGNTKKVDGLMTMLPALGIGISGAEAAMLGNALKEQYADGKSHLTDAGKAVFKKLNDYMVRENYTSEDGCPSCFLANLTTEVNKLLSDKISKGIPLTDDQLSTMTSKISEGEKEITDYNSRNAILQKGISAGIEQNLKGSNKEMWQKYTKKDKATGFFQYINPSELTKNLGNVGIIESNSLGGQRAVKAITGAEFAKAYQAGKVTFGASSINNNQAPAISIKNADGSYSEIDGGSAQKVIEYKHAMTDLASIQKNKEAIDANVFSQMPGSAKDGSIGHGISYPITKPAGTVEGSPGYKLIAETTNPANAIPLGFETNDPVKNLIQGLKGNNVNTVADVRYNTQGSVTLIFDPSQMKDLKASYGLSDKDVTTIISQGITFKMEPGASGSIMSKLPRPETYQIYDNLNNGGDLSSSALQDAMGFHYHAYGDNYGSKNTKAKKIFIEMEGKTWGIKEGSVPPVYAWIADPTNTKKFEVPIGKKLPDEIADMIDGQWKTHAKAQNQLLIAYREQLKANHAAAATSTQPKTYAEFIKLQGSN